MENNLIVAYQQAVENFRDSERKTNLYMNQISKADQALQLLLTESSTGNLQFDTILKMEQLLVKYRLLYEEANSKKLVAIATLEYLVSN